LRDMCVQVTLLTPVLAAKQHELTYYRQRDGIVKSVERLIRRPGVVGPDCAIRVKAAKSGWRRVPAAYGRSKNGHDVTLS
jgi:hypothetical protein